MTPVGSSVLQSAPPDDQCSVAVGYQGWVNREVLMPCALFAAARAAALQGEDHHVLSQPADGLIAAGLEAAGEPAVLGHGAHHSHVCNRQGTFQTLSVQRSARTSSGGEFQMGFRRRGRHGD